MSQIDVSVGEAIYARERAVGRPDKVFQATIKEMTGNGAFVFTPNGIRRFVWFKDLALSKEGPWGREALVKNKKIESGASNGNGNGHAKLHVVDDAPKPSKREFRDVIREITGCRDVIFNKAVKKDLVLDEENCGYVLVTPELAERWLSNADAHDDLPKANVRGLTNARVELYVRKIKEGSWSAALGDPVAFDGNGRMTNGQHRCWAVVEAGQPVKMRVMFNAGTREEQNFDTGLVRPIHVLVKKSRGDMTVLQAIRRYATDRHRGPLTPEETLALHQVYERSLEWLANVPATTDGKRMVRGADIMAVLVRAHAGGEDERMLTAFLQKLRRETITVDVEITSNQEKIIDRLGQWLAATPSHGDNIRAERTAKTEWALKVFLKDEPFHGRLIAANNPIWMTPVKK